MWNLRRTHIPDAYGSRPCVLPREDKDLWGLCSWCSLPQVQLGAGILRRMVYRKSRGCSSVAREGCGVSKGEIIETSKTGGQKAANDVRVGLIPGRELLEVAELFGKGAKKYSSWNWARGYDWSLSYDALNRHLWEWWLGSEFDNGEGGTGQEHLDCVIFHALVLKYFRKHHRQFDDRHIPPAPDLANE